jgi:uncharacterized protein
MTTVIRDNPQESRYELDVDGKIVFAIYRRDDSTLYIRHVEAPPSLRGTGAAGRLMQGIVDLARDERLSIVPLCSYAAAWMRRHRPHS